MTAVIIPYMCRHMCRHVAAHVPGTRHMTKKAGTCAGCAGVPDNYGGHEISTWRYAFIRAY